MSLSIPCVLMRAGTSRGPFFLRDWLPEGDEARDQALIGAIGASDPLQLDGLGGGSTLNSKVAIVSRSSVPGCDLDYLFAQVGVGHRSVDTRPNCGNMLSGVAPFAIEQGLIPAQDGTTKVRIHNVNTGSQIEATVCTPGGTAAGRTTSAPTPRQSRSPASATSAAETMPSAQPSPQAAHATNCRPASASRGSRSGI